MTCRLLGSDIGQCPNCEESEDWSTEVTPADGATAATNTDINAVEGDKAFNGNRTPDLALFEGTTVSNNPNSVSGDSQYDDETKTVSFTPDSALDHDTSHAARLCITDDEDDTDQECCQWTFRTELQPPAPPPTPPSTYRLKVVVDPPEGGMVTGDIDPITANGAPNPIDCPDDCFGTYTDGDRVDLTATAAAYYRFKGWTQQVGLTRFDDRRLDAEPNELTVTMDINRTVTAEFSREDNGAPFNCQTQISKTGNSGERLIEGTCEDPEGDPFIMSHYVIRQDGRPFFCPDYAPGFDKVIETGDLTRYVIPNLEPGVRYCTKACFTDLGSLQEVCSAEVCTVVGSNQSLGSLFLPGGSLLKDYRMLSLDFFPPIPFATDTIKVSLQAYPGDAMIGAWDNVSRQYIGYTRLRLDPAQGFWYLYRLDHTIPLFGIPVSRTVPFYKAYSRGWHQIGTPVGRKFWNDVKVVIYDEQCGEIFGPVRIGDLPNPNAYLDKNLYEFKNGIYVPSSTLEPYNAYFVFILQDLVLIFE